MGLLNHCKRTQKHFRFLDLQALSCALILSFTGCESKIIVDKKFASKTSASATSLKPITAMPGDIVSVTGTGFKSKQKNLVKITAATGDELTAPVTVTSDTAATFVMPEGAGLGLTSVVLESNGQQMTGPMSFVADLASNTLDIFIGDASEICSTKQYIDRNGDTQTGTKNCSGTGGTTPSCTADGGSNCVVDGTTYVAASKANAVSGNIKAGVVLAGVTGNVTAESHSNCSADGATGCVAVATYPAALASGAASKILSGQTLAGVSGNVTLPAVGKVLTGTAYGVGGTGSTGTLTIPTASFVLDTAPAYGDPGTPQTPSLTSRGTWNLTTSFPGAGYYAGVSNTPTAATILTGTTIIGVAGSATGAPANCSSAGQQTCVATGTYFAGTACTANSSACYLPTYALTTQPLKAISYDTISSSAASIRSGTTLGGVAGTLTDCSADGATGCVTTASYKSANMTNAIPNNIKNSVIIAGVTGALDSPNAWDLRAGVTVGSTTGKLQVNCRNGATLGTFDQAEYPKSATVDNTTDFITVTAHGWSDNQTVRIYYVGAPTGLSYNTTYYVRNSTANTFQLSLTSGGVAINITGNGFSVFVYKWGDAVTQIWDTIDDYNGYASSIPTYTGWSAANNTCGGIESVADDANVWKDVTTTGDGVTASTCTATAAHCSMKDKISGLEWHNPDTTGRDWTTALSYCDNLSYNGKTDWRLPTQKELMATYTDGIMSTANATNWITSGNLQQNYWSSSSASYYITTAWYVSPAHGLTFSDIKYNTFRVICVRP